MYVNTLREHVFKCFWKIHLWQWLWKRNFMVKSNKIWYFYIIVSLASLLCTRNVLALHRLDLPTTSTLIVVLAIELWPPTQLSSNLLLSRALTALAPKIRSTTEYSKDRQAVVDKDDRKVHNRRSRPHQSARQPHQSACQPATSSNYRLCLKGPFS